MNISDRMASKLQGIGTQYSERAIPQLHWTFNYMHKLDLKGLGLLVDVGCRDGLTSMELARCYPGAHVIGIDSSITFLEIANENLAKQAIPNLEFRLIDPLPMDFHGKVDAFVSFSFLHWVVDKLSLLKAMHRSLKPGGKAYLSFFANHQRERFDRCLTHVMHYEKWQPYFSNVKLAYREIKGYEFANLTHEAGFVLDKLEFIEIHEVFKSKENFMEWLPTWACVFEYLPQELHEPFLSDVVENHLEMHPPEAEGSIHWKDYILEAALLNVP